MLAVLQVLAARCRDLFSHPLWLDETFTHRIANDPSFVHMLSAIRGGADTNPPTMYFFLWPIARVFGTINNTGLRAISLMWMLIGLTGVYAICRRYFSRGASIVAVLAMWAHPLIVDQAFEARFYAPWLALTTWFCYLQLTADENETKLHKTARYLLAILATSIHYFGVIAMTMIAATDLVVHRRIRRVVPVLIGVLVVAACYPFINGQRAGLSIPTWIDPVSAADIKDDIVAVFGAPPIILVVLVTWIANLLRHRESASDVPARNLRELLPLSSLLLFPLAIVAFSVLVQPALVLRYLILAIIPLAPMLAALIERAGKRAILVTAIALIGVGPVAIVGKSHATRGLDAEFQATIDAIDQHVPSDALIVFKRRREMYPVLQMRPDLIARSAQLDFDDSVRDNVTRMSIYERDIGRKFAAIYPEFRTLGPVELSRTNKFYVIAPIEDAHAELTELQAELPGFRIAHPNAIVHEVRPK